MEDKRSKENERVKPRFKIHIDDVEHLVKIIDISSTGCHIETTNKYGLGDTCTLSIKLGDSKDTTSLSGKIVWGKLQEKQVLDEEDNYEYGITFQETNGMDTSEIVDLIMKSIG